LSCIQLTSPTEEKLNLSIAPARVRLKPAAIDGYMWQKPPEKNHLFEKQLSKQSVGVYVELYHGINVWFEAVALPRHGNISCTKTANGYSGVTDIVEDLSFTSRINYLETENAKQAYELGHLRDQEQVNSHARQQAEEKVEQLQTDLYHTQERNRKLEQQIIQLSSRVMHFRSKAFQSTEGINKALLALQTLHYEEGIESNQLLNSET